MADYVRGAVIEPGETFSINDYVGQRTVAQGFVDAPIIDDGNEFDTDVGGGVSQFATTAFNAAFFAGLDIRRVPEPLDLHRPLSLRARGHALLAPPRPEDQEHHARTAS